MLEGRSMIETSPVNSPAAPREGAGSRRTAKLVILVVIVTAVVAGVVFRGIQSRTRSASVVKQNTLDLAVPAVALIHPKPGALRDEIVLPGNIQAFIDAPIYARASGYLKTWSTDIGARVKAGEVLAQIEAPELDQQVQQARAAVQQSQAALDQALANYQQGKANEEFARLTAQRWSSLANRGVVSRQENDQYQAQFQAQTANLQALDKAIAAMRSSLSAAQANVARLEDMQGYKTVKAPFDGVITARNTDVGALINAGNGGPAQELFHIAALNKLRVYVNVPQTYSRSAIPGIAAELTLAEFPGRRFRGSLVRTAEAMDAGTRTLLAEVDVDNASGELRPGAYAEVHLTLREAAQSLLVPVSVLLFRSEGLRIGVVRNGKADLVPVILGKDYGAEVEVLSGITASDSIIANPPDSLTSGASVRVVPLR
jgi:RND family efflux transporter MFP subunit